MTIYYFPDLGLCKNQSLHVERFPVARDKQFRLKSWYIYFAFPQNFRKRHILKQQRFLAALFFRSDPRKISSKAVNPFFYKAKAKYWKTAFADLFKTFSLCQKHCLENTTTKEGSLYPHILRNFQKLNFRVF